MNSRPDSDPPEIPRPNTETPSYRKGRSVQTSVRASMQERSDSWSCRESARCPASSASFPRPEFPARSSWVDQRWFAAAAWRVAGQPAPPELARESLDSLALLEQEPLLPVPMLQRAVHPASALARNRCSQEPDIARPQSSNGKFSYGKYHSTEPSQPDGGGFQNRHKTALRALTLDYQSVSFHDPASVKFAVKNCNAKASD